jgi:hypothetical protein
MSTLSSSVSGRFRPRRPRRRVFYFAEVLETRQLLSVALPHPMAAPIGNIPAIVGPAVPSPVNTSPPSTPAANPSQPTPIASSINQVAFSITFGGGGIAETIVIIEEPFASGIISPSPTPASSNPATAQNTGASSGATSSITPLTATILAGNPGVNRTPVIVIIVPQTPLINLAPSTTPATTQAILAQALLEEQPIPPPILGQSFEAPVGQGFLLPPNTNLLGPSMLRVEIEMPLPAIDYIEPFQPEVLIPPPTEPAQPAEPAQPTEPSAGGFADPVEALGLQPSDLTDWENRPSLPILSPRTDAAATDEYPTWSLATMVGTAAIATGGYQLLMGEASRFNQRWIPARRSGTESRERRSKATS